MVIHLLQGTITTFCRYHSGPNNELETKHYGKIKLSFWHPLCVLLAIDGALYSRNFAVSECQHKNLRSFRAFNRNQYAFTRWNISWQQ